MRKLKVLALMVLVCVSVWGQEGQVENTPIYYKGGNVGIGHDLSVPAGKLNIYGGGGSYDTPTLRLQGNHPSSAWSLIELYGSNFDSKYDYMIGRGSKNFLSGRSLTIHVPNNNVYGGGVQPKIAFVSSASNTLGTIEAQTGNWYLKGNVGIGITSPSVKLEVLKGGSLVTTTENNLVAKFSDSNAWCGIGIYGGSNHGTFIHMGDPQNPKSTEIISHGTGILRIKTRGNEHLRINSNGNVGIGTTNPGDYKLAVEGIIGAHEIKVTTDGWADFVFDQDYALPQLQEVEAYIQEHNHLPNIPSEQEVKENGIALGDMDAKLLRKIEELTLYAIQQNAEVERQKLKVESLEEERKRETEDRNKETAAREKLEKRLERLEALLLNSEK